MRRGYNELDGCVDPRNPTGPHCTLYVSESSLLRDYKYRPLLAMNLITGAKVLQTPDVIFKGIRKEQEPGFGYCFTGRPSAWHVSGGATAPFPRDLVYCVFVSTGLVVYHWRADGGVDSEHGIVPVDWENRFEEVLWARQKSSSP